MALDLAPTEEFSKSPTYFYSSALVLEGGLVLPDFCSNCNILYGTLNGLWYERHILMHVLLQMDTN